MSLSFQQAEMTTSNGKEKSKKKEKEESERDRKKRLISEPIVVKHTSHLGIDGSSFGLLQVSGYWLQIRYLQEQGLAYFHSVAVRVPLYSKRYFYDLADTEHL